MTRKLIALALLAGLAFMPTVTFAQVDPAEQLLIDRNASDGNPNDNKTKLITQKSATGELTIDERCCLRHIPNTNDYKGGIVDFVAKKIDKCPPERETQFTLRDKEDGSRVCPLSIHKN